MANRRMFTKTITESDAFLELPLSTQALYFHLSMQADDDGFVNGPKKIMRMIGSSKNEYDLLVGRKFLLEFDDGIIVIKHWLMHNQLRKDRYKETVYTQQKEMLFTKANKAYTLDSTKGEPLVAKRLPNGCQTVALGKVSLGKESIGKVSKEKKGSVFVKPTVSDVKEYCDERLNSINPESFIDFYESKGWMVGRNKMKDWKACVRTWENKARNKNDSTVKVVDF